MSTILFTAICTIRMAAIATTMGPSRWLDPQERMARKRMMPPGYKVTT
jgi:hypothetical protein